MMIALASDHVGLELKNVVKEHLNARGEPWKDYGTDSSDCCNYPEYAWKAARAVAGRECSLGILFCGTGIGMGIAANKVNGIRCGTCSDAYSAASSRKHNNANMLALGERVVGKELALLIVDSFLDSTYEYGRHEVRLKQIQSIEDNAEPISERSLAASKAHEIGPTKRIHDING